MPDVLHAVRVTTLARGYIGLRLRLSYWVKDKRQKCRNGGNSVNKWKWRKQVEMVETSEMAETSGNGGNKWKWQKQEKQVEMAYRIRSIRRRSY